MKTFLIIGLFALAGALLAMSSGVHRFDTIQVKNIEVINEEGELIARLGASSADGSPIFQIFARPEEDITQYDIFRLVRYEDHCEMHFSKGPYRERRISLKPNSPSIEVYRDRKRAKVGIQGIECR